MSKPLDTAVGPHRVLCMEAATAVYPHLANRMEPGDLALELETSPRCAVVLILKREHRYDLADAIGLPAEMEAVRPHFAAEDGSPDDVDPRGHEDAVDEAQEREEQATFRELLERVWQHIEDDEAIPADLADEVNAAL